jgi:enamine deaminase RidA (YjgF/YER057c/UK114 family)
MRVLQPPGWPRPRGYANGIAADAGGTLVFVGGQIGWDAETGEFPDRDLVGQVRRTLSNVLAVLAEAGGRPEHVVRLTWYVTNRHEYLKSARDIGAVYRDLMGGHYPAMAVVEVTALVEAKAKVEIEATAVVPPESL